VRLTLANDHFMDTTRYLAASDTHLAELASGLLARTGHGPGVKADYDPFEWSCGGAGSD
jgi:hypothetical protein